LRIIAWIKGASVTVKNIAFDQIISALQEGQCDIGAAAITITPDRDEFVRCMISEMYRS
jgi:ABC-type amino acid transport substrate-binding protein